MVNEQNEINLVRVRRGSVDSLDIYEITKDELDILKQGSPNSIFLNISIASFSIFLSFITTLLSIKIESVKIFCVFVIALIVSLVTGIITSILWWKGENIFKKTIRKIEERMIGDDLIINDNSISLEKKREPDKSIKNAE